MGSSLTVLIEDIYAIMMAMQNKVQFSEEDGRRLAIISNLVNKHLQRKDIPSYSYQQLIVIPKEQARDIFGDYYKQLEALEVLREVAYGKSGAKYG